MMGISEKIPKFNLEPRGDANFRTDFKWLAHKLWMLKSNFKFVGRKFVSCFFAVQNFKKFG